MPNIDGLSWCLPITGIFARRYLRLMNTGVVYKNSGSPPVAAIGIGLTRQENMRWSDIAMFTKHQYRRRDHEVNLLCHAER
jgi:hypothetical protein